MWTTGATHVIARVTGSTLFANSNIVSIFGLDHRSVSTTNDQISSLSDKTDENSTLMKKMRDLRALTPYAYFVKDHYPEISRKNPNLKMTDLSRKLSEVWKNLPEDERKTYAKKSEEQKEAYTKERKSLSAADLQKLDLDEKTRKAQNRVKKSLQNLPTRKPRTAFIHFLATLDRGEANIQEFMRGAAKRWSQLTVQEKQKFEELHQEEKEKYGKALLAWALENDLASESKVQPGSSSTAVEKSVAKVRTTTAAAAASSDKTVKKKADSTSSKKAVSAAKSPSKKSSQTNADDKESSSSSSSDDESPPKLKRSGK